MHRRHGFEGGKVDQLNAHLREHFKREITVIRVRHLTELEQVSWSKLSHAYGNASNVPNLIRGLTSFWKLKRKRSLEDLCSSICHQGSVFSATPFAVPFLIGLLTRNKQRDRDRILETLALLARGLSFLDRHQSCPIPPFAVERYTQEFQKRRLQELQWVSETRAAVSAGLHYYLPYLESDVQEESVSAHYLLGELEDGVGRELLIKRLLDQPPLHEDVLATAIFSLRRQAHCDTRLISKFRDHQNPIVRFGVAILCAKFAKEAADISLLINLADFLVSYRFGEQFSHLPFYWDFSLCQFAGELLQELQPDAQQSELMDELAWYLTFKLADADEDGFEYGVATLLSLTFSASTGWTELTPLQREVLSRIYQHELTWNSCEECKFACFEEHRLPRQRAGFRALLWKAAQDE